MTTPTKAAKEFMDENDKSKTVEGYANGAAKGGTYILENGKSFRLTLEDCQSLPDDYPKWLL